MKEKFNDIIAPLKYLDSKIARGYAKLVKKWEEKGHSRYTLGHIAILPTFVTSLNSHIFNNIYSGWLRGFDMAQNLIGSVRGKHNDGCKEVNGKLIINDKYFFYQNKFNRVLAPPLFVYGLVNFGAVLFEFFNTGVNGEQTDLNKIFLNINEGCTAFGWASSVYIKIRILNF